jgi:4-hydroxyphenylpyruvate dioxygenase
MATATLPTAEPGADVFPINGTDYIEFWVGNARQASHYYRTAFGFQLVAYRGPETGTRDRASYLMEQGKIRLILTTPLGPDGQIAEHLRRHGDGVRDLALWVNDARDAWKLATERGAQSVREPEVLSDDDGEIVIAAIQTYGDTIHTLVERSGYRGTFMPGFRPMKPLYQPKPVGLEYVDHCVGNVELGAMNKWVKFYEDVMGFRNLISFDDKDISTEYSSLMSKVSPTATSASSSRSTSRRRVARSRRSTSTSSSTAGPGVQHMALATDDIIHTVTASCETGASTS